VFHPAFDSLRNRVADARRSGDLYFATLISQETINQETINSCFSDASAILNSGRIYHHVRYAVGLPFASHESSSRMCPGGRQVDHLAPACPAWVVVAGGNRRANGSQFASPSESPNAEGRVWRKRRRQAHGSLHSPCHTIAPWRVACHPLFTPNFGQAFG